jgi:hypothetical protein
MAQEIRGITMTSQNDTKEDHGSQEPSRPPGRDGPSSGRSGHGSDSALAQVISQHKERQQGGEPDDAAGARGQ